MRIDKKMMLEDATRCLKSCKSIVFFAISDMNAKKYLGLRTIARSFGSSVLFKSFPKRILFKVFEDLQSIKISHSDCNGNLVVVGVDDQMDVAEIVGEVIGYNSQCNAGVKKSQHAKYVTAFSGLVDGIFYGVNESEVLEKLVTLKSSRAEFIGLITNPMASLLGMIEHKGKE
ncbi:MAG: hypothetical protein KAH32_02165 [Chlamydiia bacterium]|nr:hypothetical protein [Chlamydiia bacterium]